MGQQLRVGPPDPLPLEKPSADLQSTRELLPSFELTRAWHLRSPDGRWAVSTSWYPGDGAEVRDARTGELVRRLTTVPTRVWFSPDGKWLVTGTATEYVFWQVGSWMTGIKIPIHRDITGLTAFSPVDKLLAGLLAFSPDGKLLAVTYLPWEGVRLVAAANGGELATLFCAEPDRRYALTFSPDGSQLAVVTGHNMIELWDLRAIRQQLAEMGLDWESAAYPPPAPWQGAGVKPLHVELNLGDLKDKDKYRLSWMDVDFRHQQALARLGADDLPGYRRACAEMLQRFGQTDYPDVACQVAWTLVLAPDSVKNLDRPLKLAERPLQGDAKNGRYSLTLGAALYRAGRFAEAIQRLNEVSPAWEQATTKPTAYSPAEIYFFLAMAHQRLGHTEDARQSLDKAMKSWREQAHQNFAIWQRNLTLDLLRREAEALLKRPVEVQPTPKKQEPEAMAPEG